MMIEKLSGIVNNQNSIAMLKADMEKDNIAPIQLDEVNEKNSEPVYDEYISSEGKEEHRKLHAGVFVSSESE